MRAWATMTSPLSVDTGCGATWHQAGKKKQYPGSPPGLLDMTRTAVTLIATLLVTMPARSVTAPSRPHVVELFTSQGCSSCPPADALLGDLIDRPDVIALAFHVDYWDSLGWRDRFSTAEATQRQRNYVDSLNLPSAFTPQMVIDGQVSMVGSDRRRVLAALTEPARGDDALPIQLSVQGKELHIAVPNAKTRSRCDVTLVAYLPKSSTVIGRGENSGHTLVEYNIVRQIRHIGTWDGTGGEYQLSLDTLPGDATHVAILLQREGQAIAGAAAMAVR